MQSRPVTVDDAPEIFALLMASDTAVLGKSDYTLTELEVDLARDNVHQVGWYDDGTLAAYGWVKVRSGSTQAELDAYVHPDRDAALGIDLVGDLESAGLAMAAEHGHDDVLFDTAAYRQDTRTQGWLRARGYDVGTTFTRMRVDFEQVSGADSTAPVPAPGVVIREIDLTVDVSQNEDDLHAAYVINEESFADHYGVVPQSFDDWHKWLVEHPPAWVRLWLAELDGDPVGVMIGTAQFVETEDAGYVRTLGVLPRGRGRGVAKAMLRLYFAAAREDGRAAVVLHVDVANVTSALALYESVGMRPVLEMDAFAKRVPVVRRATAADAKARSTTNA